MPFASSSADGIRKRRRPQAKASAEPCPLILPRPACFCSILRRGRGARIARPAVIRSRSCSMPDLTSLIREALMERFGEGLKVGDDLSGLDGLARIAVPRVPRVYLAQDVSPDLLRLLCACALSAPSKSDLQQGDILVIRDRAKRDAIAGLLTDMPWVSDAPVFFVFLANGRRLPDISRRRGKP